VLLGRAQGSADPRQKVLTVTVLWHVQACKVGTTYHCSPETQMKFMYGIHMSKWNNFISIAELEKNQNSFTNAVNVCLIAISHKTLYEVP